MYNEYNKIVNNAHLFCQGNTLIRNLKKKAQLTDRLTKSYIQNHEKLCIEGSKPFLSVQTLCTPASVLV